MAFGIRHNQIVVISFCENPILYRFGRSRARRAVFLFVVLDLGLHSFARWHAYNQCEQNKITEFYFGQIFVRAHRLAISIIQMGGSIYSNCTVAILHPFCSVIINVSGSNACGSVAKIVVESNTVIGRLPKVFVDAVTELSKPVPVMVIWV